MRSPAYLTVIKIISVVFLSVTFTNITTAQSDEQLKQQIRQALAEEGLTGAVWSVVGSSGEITVNAAGLKNRQTEEQLKPADRVHIGSVTKTILATGILRLVSENKISLEDPLEKYLPEIRFDNKWSETNSITIRHLLDHTSGLEDLRLWQMFTAKASPVSPLASAFEKDPAVLRVRTRPGSVFSYSNMGYTLLGMVIEKVARESYESYLDKNLLQPLGMASSTFGFVSQIGDKADPDLAMGHLDDQSAFSALPIFLRPAAQFTTTAYDMGLFLKFIMSDGALNGQPFVKKELLDEMGQARGTEAFQNGLQAGYGLGGMKRDRHGFIGFAHSGNIVGYHAMIYAFPDSKKAFFISHNMDSESANYERFNEILIRNLDLEKTERSAEAVKPAGGGLSDWEGYFIPVVSRFEPLAYLDTLASFTKVSIGDDKIIFSPFQKPSKELFYTGNNLLTAEGKIAASHVFYKNDENVPIISDGLSSLRKINGVSLLCYWISFCLGAVGLVYLLGSGAVQLVKYKRHIIRKPVWFSFLSIALLFVPVPFFFLQSFVSIGDPTAASILLAISTLLLPFGLLATGWLYIKNGMPEFYNKTDFLAVVFSFQWVAVLAFWRLIPFILWV
jgi:CubicO group peptidase (beta-lactamase class C family)